MPDFMGIVWNVSLPCFPSTPTQQATFMISDGASVYIMYGCLNDSRQSKFDITNGHLIWNNVDVTNAFDYQTNLFFDSAGMLCFIFNNQFTRMNPTNGLVVDMVTTNVTTDWNIGHANIVYDRDDHGYVTFRVFNNLSFTYLSDRSYSPGPNSERYDFTRDIDGYMYVAMAVSSTTFNGQPVLGNPNIGVVKYAPNFTAVWKTQFGIPSIRNNANFWTQMSQTIHNGILYQFGNTGTPNMILTTINITNGAVISGPTVLTAACTHPVIYPNFARGEIYYYCNGYFDFDSLHKICIT